MMSLQDSLALNFSSFSFAGVILFFSYVTYQCYFHPLSKFPGPILCALTDFWKLWITITGRTPEEMVRLHEKYGDVVRIGPNELHFNQALAINDIYKRGWQKGAFYVGFGNRVTSLFSERNEAQHAKRKRMFGDNFSMTALRSYENSIDSKYAILRTQLDRFAKTNEVFDLRHYITYTMVDILSELAFSEAYGNQVDEDPGRIPPVAEALYISCILGQVPWIALLWDSINKYLPLPKAVANKREKVLSLALKNIHARLGKQADRSDILGRIVFARQEDGGLPLKMEQILIEAMTLVVGGTHTTGNTLHLVFANLSRNPEILGKVIAEVDTCLPPLKPGKACYELTGLEEKLDYVNVVIKETFRVHPVSTFNLPRTVPPEGANVAGAWIPGGTQVSVNHHAIHHNPEIWGSDHETFDPDRWYDERTKNVSQCLIPFSVGRRACVGRNLAYANILKMITMLLKCYDFEFLNKDEKLHIVTRGDSELDTPILVKCRMRTSSFSLPGEDQDDV